MLVTQGVYKLHLSNLYLILPQACTQTLDLRANKQKSVWSRTLVLIQVFLGLGFFFFLEGGLVSIFLLCPAYYFIKLKAVRAK